MGNTIAARQIRLDPIGGIAGDMFCAAMLDACGELEPELASVLAAIPMPSQIKVTLEAFHDGVLSGKRLHITGAESGTHRSWGDVRSILEGSKLPKSTVRHALAIFERLAEAEARVHGIDVDKVSFHEVGAWDSIIDIVLASWLIDQSGVQSWDIAPVPIGRGRVESQHGPLPVPAPATVHLLAGLSVIDDGIEGERVTPTGAAIMAHLQSQTAASNLSGRMTRQGFGFGTRRLPGISNVLRILIVEADAATSAEQIGVIEFEIDDQTAEDLATGLDRLREHEGVLDIHQMPAMGKKGRVLNSVRLLVRPDCLRAVIDGCFHETTTLGVRWLQVERVILEREMQSSADGIEVKLARRPDGVLSAKAENDDVAKSGGAVARAEARGRAVVEALSDDD